MTDFLHTLREAIALPTGVKFLALLFIGFSPLVIIKWRKGARWYRSDK
jgi:hypothetical protein